MLADIDVTAVTALPDLLGLAGKYLAGLDVGGQGLVALLVLLLDGGHAVKELGDVVKALLPGLI